MGLSFKQLERALRDAAMAYPGAHEDFPWGERVVKVAKKVFVFLGHPQSNQFGLSVKLPQSSGAALMLPFTEPTAYGLGKAGWISASFEKGDAVPLPLLLEWLDESYRAVAPKKLVAALAAPASPSPSPASPAPARKAPRRNARAHRRGR